jgi:amidophosphoribosyltransferase
MARLNDLAAFRAAVSWLVQQGKVGLMDGLYEEVVTAIAQDKDGQKNFVQDLYAAVPEEDLLEEMARMLRPEELSCPLRLVFQRVEHLHQACPEHMGDWYFSGNYPTQGGNRFVNRAFVHFMEGSDGRSYQ